MRAGLMLLGALACAFAFAGEHINAELSFPDSPEFLKCGRTMALKPKMIRQKHGDWLVIDGVDFSRFSPENEDGRLVASEGSIAPRVVKHASDLKYVFWLAEAGQYDVWMHVKFPRRGFYNHSECMDHGVPRMIRDSENPMAPGQWLPPGVWHWVKTVTWNLVRGPHHWQWLPPSAWCAGCELDRIVLIKAGSKISPQTAGKDNCVVERAPEGTLQARRIRLGRVESWRLSPVLDAGDGRIAFERSCNGRDWSPVPLGRVVDVEPGQASLHLRLRIVSAPEGMRQPIVYGYSFEIVRKAKQASSAVRAQPACERGMRPLRVIPSKIVYSRGEKGSMTVVIENDADDERAGEVVVEEQCGVLEPWRSLWRGRVSLPPGQRRTLVVDYPGSDAAYGHEVRVTVGRSRRSEFFNVNDNWWRVNQGGYLTTADGSIMPSTRRLLDYYGYTTNDWARTPGSYMYQKWAGRMPGMGPFMGYDNIETRWQIQRSSIGGNAVTLGYPDAMRWPNVQNHAKTTGDIRRDTEVTHSRGFRHTRYTIGYLSSGYGVELAREHPEYVLRDRRGQYAGGVFMNNASLRPDILANADTFNQIPFFWFEPNFARQDAFEWALDDLVKVVKGIGEDGVYFDGRYMQHAGYDYTGADLSKQPQCDAAIVRNMRRCQEEIFNARPNGYIWSNGCTAENPELVLADHPQAGLLKETQWPFLLNPSRADHSYRGFQVGLVRFRNSVWAGGKYVRRPSKILHCGYLMTTWNAADALKYGESWVMASHVMAIIASLCAHPHAYPAPFRPFKQMMTRYSELFWHEDLDVCRDPESLFEVDSLREIWWRDSVYRRETSDFEQYTIHLVNAPEGEFCDETVTEEPPEADDVEVSVCAFGASDNVRAWAIAPYARDAEFLEPSCRELSPSVEGGRLSFAVPPFRYYSMLLVRRYGKR